MHEAMSSLDPPVSNHYENHHQLRWYLHQQNLYSQDAHYLDLYICMSYPKTYLTPYQISWHRNRYDDLLPIHGTSMHRGHGLLHCILQ